jgi:hypothetical protein
MSLTIFVVFYLLFCHSSSYPKEHIPWLTKSVEHKSSWKANSRFARHKILQLLWAPRAYFSVYKISPLDHIPQPLKCRQRPHAIRTRFLYKYFNCLSSCHLHSVYTLQASDWTFVWVSFLFHVCFMLYLKGTNCEGSHYTILSILALLSFRPNNLLALF